MLSFLLGIQVAFAIVLPIQNRLVHQLKNVVWIIDRNKLQGYGKTEEVISMEPLDEKLKSFGFEVIQVDGHDVEKLMELKSKRLLPLDVVEEEVEAIETSLVDHIALYKMFKIIAQTLKERKKQIGVIPI